MDVMGSENNLEEEDEELQPRQWSDKRNLSPELEENLRKRFRLGYT